MIASFTSRMLAAAARIALVLPLGAVLVSPVDATGSAEIDIENFTFGPATLTIAPGTAVTWINKDEEPHNVVGTVPPRAFRSGGMDGGENFTFVFDKPGTYEYICSVHPQMHGTVVVQ